MIPELSALAASQTNPEAAGVALTALSYTGSNGVSALLSAVRNPSHPYRGAAAFALGNSHDLGPYTNSVVGELIRQLDDDPDVAAHAAMALGFLHAQSDLAVPALVNHFAKTNMSSKSRLIAAGSLSSFGPDAASALPYLTNALSDPDPELRRGVTEVIKQIHARMRTQ
jgi:HEAT repeat protein